MYKVTQEVTIMEVSRVCVVTVNRDGHFLRSGHSEGAASPLQRAPATHSQKRGPGSSQAVLEAERRDRAAVVCWLGSASNKYHLGLQAFWYGGSILVPKHQIHRYSFSSKDV